MIQIVRYFKHLGHTNVKQSTVKRHIAQKNHEQSRLKFNNAENELLSKELMILAGPIAPKNQ